MIERDILTEIVQGLKKEEQGEAEFDIRRKFIYAFNNLDADMMQSVTKNKVTYVVHNTCMYWDVRFYDFLFSLRREYGEMKEAYVRRAKRKDNKGYFAAPYIENVGHLRVDINDYGSELRVKNIAEIHDENFSDVIFNPDFAILKPEEALPNIVSAEFSIEKSGDRKSFVISAVFDDGVSGKCVLPSDGKKDNVIFTYQKGYIFTDKIFRNGWVARHKYADELSGWKCSEFGQSVEFINGCSFSAVEIYQKVVGRR